MGSVGETEELAVALYRVTWVDVESWGISPTIGTTSQPE